jgi:hypothetical protein
MNFLFTKNTNKNKKEKEEEERKLSGISKLFYLHEEELILPSQYVGALIKLIPYTKEEKEEKEKKIGIKKSKNKLLNFNYYEKLIKNIIKEKLIKQNFKFKSKIIKNQNQNQNKEYYFSNTGSSSGDTTKAKESGD